MAQRTRFPSTRLILIRPWNSTPNRELNSSFGANRRRNSSASFRTFHNLKDQGLPYAPQRQRETVELRRVRWENNGRIRRGGTAMKLRNLFVISLLALILPALAAAGTVSPAQITGEYIEARTADVYTGPCFANSEVNLTGQEAVLGWRVDKGVWNDVKLDGLSIVAVVRANSSLGDAYGKRLPPKSGLIRDECATAEQRQALIKFAQAQTAGLLNNVVGVELSPIRLDIAPD